MTRRGGGLTRVTLRLGLLLGGVAVAWGAHEIATADAAQAADRPAPVRHAPHPFTGAHGPFSGWEPTTAPARHRPPTDGRAWAPPRRSQPDRPPAQAGDTPPARHRPAHRTARHRPADRRPAPSARPGQPTTAGEALRPTTRPARVVPATGAAPPAASRPGTHLVGTGVLGPVTGPLGPIVAPVWDGLKPVRDPLDPVLDPLDPVLDPLDPVLDPGDPVLDPPKSPKRAHATKPAEPATRVPGPPTDPAAAQPAVPAPSGDPDGPTTSAIRPVTGTTADRAAANHAAHAAPARWNAATDDRVPSRPALPHGPQPLNPDVTPMPDTNAPGTTGAGSTAGHGDLADAAAPGWVPPAQSGCLCRDASDDAHPSRSPRPGTRPA